MIFYLKNSGSELVIEIIIFSAILLIFIYMIRREFLSPTFAVALCFLVAASFCLIYKDEWAINLKNKTVNIILIGLISCFCGEIFATVLEQQKERNLICRIKKHNDSKEFYIDRYKIILFILMQIIVLYFYYKEVSRIAGSFTSFAVMMNSYKNAIYESSDIADNVNIIVKQLAKISYAGTIICLGVFINNCMTTKKIKRNIIYIFPVVLYIALTVLQSSRASMLQIGMAALVMFYAFWKGESNWKSRISIKVILGALGVLAVILALFWFLKEAVGRTSQKEFLEYIGFYFGGGIPFFDKYISSPNSKFTGLVGAETFTSLWGFLSKFTKYNVVGHLEFRHSGNIHGNTYTAYREYYNDFSIAGVIILEFIFSFFYTILFTKLKRLVIEKKDKYLIKVIIIAAFSYPIFYETIAAQLYRSILSVGTVTYIVIIYFMYWFFFKLCIKIR